jgi:hypothetical protein
MFQPQASGQVGKTIDDLFAEVARRVPGFGGMFLSDDETILQVYLTDLNPLVITAARAAIAAVFGAQRIPQAGIRELQGQYGFLQLKEWKDRLLPLHALLSLNVSQTGIYHSKNRLRIGLLKMNSLSLVEQELVRLSIPREAVIIEEVGHVEFLSHTVQSHIRPVIGGVQITASPSGTICTLGFNAIRSGVNGFVTASHCTNTQGGVESTVFHQPTVSGTTNRIGLETVDPTYFTGGVCPSGQRCRYSDSAFARYDTGVSFDRGIIARTGLGSINISHTYPTFRIVSKYYGVWAGETLNKVGKTTGWTQGNVDLLCQNVTIGNTTILCAHRVAANAANGDSGSPVFKITNLPQSRDVELRGVVFGGQSFLWRVWFWFSHMGDVEYELGSLTVCAPGFVC